MSTTDSPGTESRESLSSRLTRILEDQKRTQLLEQADQPEWLRRLPQQEQSFRPASNFHLEQRLLEREVSDLLETFLVETKHHWYVKMFGGEFERSRQRQAQQPDLEPSLRDKLRDSAAKTIADFLREYMPGLPQTFVSSSKLIAQILLVVIELGGAESLINEVNLSKLLERLARRRITIPGGQQCRIVLFLAYIILPIEYFIRGAAHCNLQCVASAVLVTNKQTLSWLVNRNDNVLRLRVSEICRFDVMTARKLVVDRQTAEVYVLMQQVERHELRQIGISYQLDDQFRYQPNILLQPSYCKRYLGDILVDEQTYAESPQEAMFQKRPGLALIGRICFEKSKRVEKYLRMCLPDLLQWENSNDIFSFRLRNKCQLVAPPEFLLLQKGAMLPVVVCYYNCVLLNLGDGPIDVTITPPDMFGDVQKQMFMEMHQPINRSNVWFDSAWCNMRGLSSVKLRLRAGEMAVLPIGSCYCLSAVRDCYVMSWSFVGCSLKCLQELMSLVDKTGDYKRKEVLLEALDKYRRMREKGCTMHTEHFEQMEQHEILLQYVTTVLDHLQA